MKELISKGIDQRVDGEFDAFSEVLDETDGESLYDFFDADTMANPSLPAIRQRLLKYVDAIDDDSGYEIEAGIHFAVTVTELAAYRTDRALDILSEMVADYEKLEYTQAQRDIAQAVGGYYEHSPTLDGLVQAYLMIDPDDSFDEQDLDTYIEPTKSASRLAAGMMFMAIEEQAASDDISAGIDDFLQA